MARVFFSSDPSLPRYPTIEHALAASKALDGATRAAIVACEDPIEAKRIGSKCLGKNDSPLAEAWRGKSLRVMGALVRDKYRCHPKYRERLLATGTRAFTFEEEPRVAL